MAASQVEVRPLSAAETGASESVAAGGARRGPLPGVGAGGVAGPTHQVAPPRKEPKKKGSPLPPPQEEEAMWVFEMPVNSQAFPDKRRHCTVRVPPGSTAKELRAAVLADVNRLGRRGVYERRVLQDILITSVVEHAGKSVARVVPNSYVLQKENAFELAVLSRPRVKGGAATSPIQGVGAEVPGNAAGAEEGGEDGGQPAPAGGLLGGEGPPGPAAGAPEGGPPPTPPLSAASRKEKLHNALEATRQFLVDVKRRPFAQGVGLED